jgi:hypothetical protein
MKTFLISLKLMEENLVSEKFDEQFLPQALAAKAIKKQLKSVKEYFDHGGMKFMTPNWV